jgi:hypothetical protein
VQVQWSLVNWDTLGLEHFVPIKWLPQLREVSYKEFKMIKQVTNDVKIGKLPFTK